MTDRCANLECRDPHSGPLVLFTPRGLRMYLCGPCVTVALTVGWDVTPASEPELDWHGGGLD